MILSFVVCCRPAEDSDTDIYSDVEAVDTGAHDQSWSSTEVEGLGTDVKVKSYI